VLKSVPVVVRDGVVGLVLLLLVLLPLGIPGVELGELHRSVAAWVTSVLAAGQTLPLALRRIRPSLTLLLVGGSFGASQLLGAEAGVAGLGTFVAIYSFAAYQRPRRLAYEVAFTVVYAALALVLHQEGSPNRLIDWVTFFCALLIPWFIGALVRSRIAEQAIREAQAAEIAVQDARNQLARDLHDIVTHHLTAMVVQAESVSYLDPADSAERERILATISDTGRSALRELRSLLGALEHSHAGAQVGSMPPAPLDAGIRNLVEDARARGYPVTITERGGPGELSDAVAVTLYRVAQEALTNAMKHAPGREMEVVLTHRRDGVELSVVNPMGHGDRGTPGRGLRGMAERVALVGGTLDTGSREGRFCVRASLPRRPRDESEREPTK
jgi:signal transduction histidine kinase